MAKIKPLTADQIDRLAERQAEAIQTPAHTVSSVLVSVFVSGIGGAAVGGVALLLLSAIGAPGYILFEWSGRVGLLAAFLYLAAWSFPLGRIQSVRWWAEARAEIRRHEFHKLEAYRELVAIKAQDAARIAELQKALELAHTDLRNSRLDLRRMQEQVQHSGYRRTFVAKSNTEPQAVRDAQTILHHWFETGTWLSRSRAAQSGWSEDRHNAAVRLLDDAELVGKVGKLREIQAQSLDAALGQLADWCESAQISPVLPIGSSIYVEQEQAEN